MRSRSKILVGVMTMMLLTPYLSVWNVSAGPLESFTQSPVPFWDDYNEAVTFTYDTDEQTIEIENDTENDYTESRYFQECFDDMSDWQDHSQGGLAGGDWGFDSDSGIGEIWIVCDDAGGEYAYFKEAVDMVITAEMYFSVRYRVEDTDVSIGTRITGTGLDDWPSVTTSTTYETETAWIGDHAGKTIDYVYVYIDDNPNAVNSGNHSGYYDWITIGEETLDFAVPMMKDDTTHIEFMMNTTDLDDTEVRTQLYDDQTESGMYVDFNSTHVIFPTETFLEQTVVEMNENMTRFLFEIDNTNRVGTVTLMDQDMSILDYCTYSLIRAGNNWLNFTSDDFEGSMTMFYLTGNTNYTTWYARPEWEGSGDYNALVQQGIWTMGCEEDSDPVSVEHSVMYTVELPYFAYLRTEWNLIKMFDDPTSPDAAPNVSQNMTVTVYDNNDVPQVMINFNLTADNSSFDGTTEWEILTYDGSWSSQVSVSGTYNLYDGGVVPFYGKSMIWRNKEDYLGVMTWNEQDSWSLYGDNETVWTSNEPYQWNYATIELGYDIDYHHAVNDLNVSMNFDYFEYEYWQSVGLAQPHFSSTEHDRGYRIPPVIVVDNSTVDPWLGMISWWGTQFMTLGSWLGGVGNTISGGIDAIAPGLSGMFGGVIGAIGGILAHGLNGVGGALLSAIMGSLNLLAQSFALILDAIFGEGTGNILLSTLAGITGTVSSIFSLIVVFLGWLSMFSLVIAAFVTWASKFLITEQVSQMVFLAMIGLPLLSLIGHDIFGKGKGIEGATAWIVLYFQIGNKILSAAYGLITNTMNTISGFIPFT